MEIRKYITEDGKAPVDDWLYQLRDKRALARILMRMERLKLGLLGDYKSVGHGIFEIRINEGQGFRLYFAFISAANTDISPSKSLQSAILLLLGGNKSSQARDIKRARKYWVEHKRNTQHG